MPLKVDFKFEDNRRDIMKKVSSGVTKALHESGSILVSASQAAVPVDEGNLKRSIKYEVSPTKGTGSLSAGGPGAQHANLVEFGTWKMAPQSFLRGPGERLKGAIRKLFTGVLGRGR